MAKARSKKKPAAKPKNEPSSYALSLGWVAAETLLVPGAYLAVLFVLLSRFADAGMAVAQIVILGIFVAVRLPLLVYTLARDPRIVLGKEALRVPIVSVLQFRAWTIPFDDIVSIGETRKSGGATKIVIAQRSGKVRRFAASVLRDRATVIRAIERRID